MRRGASLSLGVLALVLQSGCASTALPPPAVAERARSARSYSARLRVTLRSPDLRARTVALVAFRRPDALRIEIPGPTGARFTAVVRGDRLEAVFPAERAVFSGGSSPSELEALLGLSLSPGEIMDLLVGVASPRLRTCAFGWGHALPRRIEATLPDGAELKVIVEEADQDRALPEEAFAEPAHIGYRQVEAVEARRLWSAR